LLLFFYKVKIIRTTFKTIKLYHYTNSAQPTDLFPSADSDKVQVVGENTIEVTNISSIYVEGME